MEEVEGAQAFQATGQAYDLFMGRYAKPLAEEFADAAGVRAGWTALDVGCGPGALTGTLVNRLGAAAVAAVDPSPPFVADCRARHPGVDVRDGRAESLPFDDGGFDAALSQLVFHFVSDPQQAATELFRVLRPGGVAAACVWDVAEGMEMLRHFWDAALQLDRQAPDEARALHFGGVGELAGLLSANGFEEVTDQELRVRSDYADFDELWAGFLAGIGPAGGYCMGLPPDQRGALRDNLFRTMESPRGGFSLQATARCATGRRPAGS